MNKNENNIGPAESGGGRVVWTCPVCRISCDDRFCPMCGISREVAIAFSGSVEPQVSAARDSGDETGSWPSVSASAEKNEIYRQRISDSEALKGLTGMLDVIQTADTEEPADANGGAAPAPESVMTPEEEEIESFSRPRERTQPIPGDSPVDISAELASLTAHSRLDAPVIDIPDRPAYQPYVPPKREKVKLPRTSAASPEPLLPPELTPVFDDLPSEPLPEDRPEGYVSPVQQTAAAPENNVVQPYQEEAAGTAQSVPYYQETAAPAPDTEAGGRVTRYDTASHQAVRPRRAARRSDTSETPAVQAAQTASETYPTAAAPSDTDQAARPETPDAQQAQEKQVVYVETGDKAGLWKPVAIIGILLSAVLLLTLTYVYVKYAILIPKYG
ncbi:MAG: hypothetical protein K6D94_06190, partial [Clostridiales bacterium]|nr:hypothetical protein [Clostridiales bacterium]